MSADHLTTAPYQLAVGVQAVLAGVDLNAAATDCGLSAADLDEAVQTYHAAGLAALEQRAEHAWYQVNIEFSDWSTAETIGTTRLDPRFAHLQERGELGNWWFLRKHPCWRLRLRGADVAAVNQLLDELTTTSAIARWWHTTYEPETTAFGGTTGMDTIHDLFCADSRGVLDYLRHEHPGIGRRELSILLISGLFQAAGLDPFERGDVFAPNRPAPAHTHRRQHHAYRTARGERACSPVSPGSVDQRAVQPWRVSSAREPMARRVPNRRASARYRSHPRPAETRSPSSPHPRADLPLEPLRPVSHQPKHPRPCRDQGTPTWHRQPTKASSGRRCSLRNSAQPSATVRNCDCGAPKGVEVQAKDAESRVRKLVQLNINFVGALRLMSVTYTATLRERTVVFLTCLLDAERAAGP